MQQISQAKIQSLMQSLEKRNISAYYVEKKEDALALVKEMIPAGSTVSTGGSQTLKQTGIIDYLKSGPVTYLDRTDPTLSWEQKKAVEKAGLTADVFLSSTNAITEDGKLFNIDGNGNRVAAMLYGPEKVIIVTGVNKIVETEEDAEWRVRNVASPPNTVRLNKKTPCATLGKCMDCNSPDRICNEFVWIVRQRDKGRMHVVIVGEELGF